LRLPASPAPLSPTQTAQALPYPRLADSVRALLMDPSVCVPPRLIQPLAAGGSLFVMPASDERLAMVKLISFVADNPARALPAIQGDVVVFDARDGTRLQVLDGPTVTARRTAAVSLLAARELAPAPEGRLLIVGAGVQGRAHLEAFAQGLGVREVRVASRAAASADALVAHARGLGLRAERVDDADAALAECTLVASCTSAQGVALRGLPRDDAFVCAVGAFTPRMVEWSPEVCRDLAARGRVVRYGPLCHAGRRGQPAPGLDAARCCARRAGVFQELWLGGLGSGGGALRGAPVSRPGPTPHLGTRGTISPSTRLRTNWSLARRTSLQFSAASCSCVHRRPFSARHCPLPWKRELVLTKK